MICTTVRKDQDCVFMAAQGCTYNGGSCHSVVESCEGCKRIIEFETGLYCFSTPEPLMKWKNGNCNLATHVAATAKKVEAKLNPIKASKRKA